MEHEKARHEDGFVRQRFRERQIGAWDGSGTDVEIFNTPGGLTTDFLSEVFWGE
jgi:hypothetical protein